MYVGCVAYMRVCICVTDVACVVGFAFVYVRVCVCVYV